MFINNTKVFMFTLLFFSTLLVAEDALIWYPGGKALSSAQTIQTELAANFKTSLLTTSLSGKTLANYDYLFICLGLYPNNYVLKESTDGASIDAVINYLAADGNVYMEGGDTWAWDFPTDLHAWFNLYGEADGEGDLGTLYGAACFSDLIFDYGGSRQHVDRIAPLDGSIVIFTNNQPAYACGIAYEDGYRTIAVSFEFGGLNNGDDSKTNLMSQFLDFFANGCSAGKPAPMNVHAFSDYHNAVPLAWETPPGQTFLALHQLLAPSLTFSRHSSIPRQDNKIAGRTRQSQPEINLAKITAAGYQADSYNIYRSTSENGTFIKIASNINRCYYRDETVTNGLTYYYYIKGLYDGQEGEASLKTSAQPSSQNSAASPWKFSTPVVNGFLQTDEWTNAASKTITAPGAANPATLYLFHDDEYLYFAIDDPGNATLNADDQVGFNFDSNLDFNWPTASITDEGTLWLSWAGGALGNLFRGLSGHWPLNMNWANPVSASGVTSAVSTSSGHVQFEAKIDLASSPIKSSPGESIGLCTYSLNMPDSIFTAFWPTAIPAAPWHDAWMLPALYGTIELSEKGACPFIVDDENVASLSNYQFNEFGDGRKIQMTFNTLAGSGLVSVQQSNGCLTNPINDKYINCVWTISAAAGIASFTADVSIYYNNNDVSGLDETKLQVHWWNGSTWQYEGGTVDVAANKITFRTNHFGEFALYERAHVLLNVDVFLEGAYAGSHLMRKNLNEQGLLPLTSTYTDGRVLHSFPGEVCDWVSVELRNTAAGTPASQRSFLLNKDGRIVDWDGVTFNLSLPDVVDGDYFVVVSHRNHLAVMSATTIALTASTPMGLNFTSSNTSYYGGDAKLLESGVYGMYTGDANNNGQVQNDDKNDFWQVQVGASGYLSADFNLNGQVQNDDKNDFWKYNVGRGTLVP